MFLKRYIDTMVTYLVEKLTITCLPMFKHYFDTAIVALADRVVVMILQIVLEVLRSVENSFLREFCSES